MKDERAGSSRHIRQRVPGLMMSNLAQTAIGGIPKGKSGLIARLWPNGEATFHYPKKLKESSVSGYKPIDSDSIQACFIRAYGVSGALAALSSMGLLNVSNSDKPKKLITRKGLKGITSKGKRTVRNACYLLESESEKRLLTFATVTCPSLSDDDMGILHENWHRIVEAYRREISRELKRHGLPGEIVGVTEIQPKRFKDSGKPVLHCHFVFKGRRRGSDWAIKPAKHDEIWLRCLSLVIPGRVDHVISAAQLKRVDCSAEGYLSKYLSKGKDDIAAVVAAGYQHWIPAQWWNCSRSLASRVKRALRIFQAGTGWLVDMGESRCPSTWLYFHPIERIGKYGDKICVGYCGKLSNTVNMLIRQEDFLKRPEDVGEMSINY